jgi:protein-disulfide isomerase
VAVTRNATPDDPASDQVLGTPTLFIDGVVHRGGYDPPALLAALAP